MNKETKSKKRGQEKKTKERNAIRNIKHTEIHQNHNQPSLKSDIYFFFFITVTQNLNKA